MSVNAIAGGGPRLGEAARASSGTAARSEGGAFERVLGQAAERRAGEVPARAPAADDAGRTVAPPARAPGDDGGRTVDEGGERAGVRAARGARGRRDEDDDGAARGRGGAVQSAGDAVALLAALLHLERAIAPRGPEAAPPTVAPAVEPTVELAIEATPSAAIGAAPQTTAMTAPTATALGGEAPRDASALPSVTPALDGADRAAADRGAAIRLEPAATASEGATDSDARDRTALGTTPNADGAAGARSDDAPRASAPDPLTVAHLLHEAARPPSAAPEVAPVERAAPTAPTAATTGGADEAGPVDGRLTGERAEIRIGSGEDAVSLRVSTVGHRVRVEASAATAELARSLVEHRAELDRALGGAGLSLASFASSADGERRRSPPHDSPADAHPDAPAPPPAAPSTLERSAHAHRRFA